MDILPRWASSSLSLKGNQCVDFGTPAVFSDFTSFTFEAWINPSGFSGQQSIISRGDTGHTTGCWLYLTENSVAATVYHGSDAYTVKSSAPVSAGEWLHVAATFDGNSGSFCLYINGAQTDVLQCPVPMNASNASVLAGAAYSNQKQSFYFNGMIGRIMVWNEARTDEEILNDAAQVSDQDSIKPSLLLYVDYSQTPFLDRSGYNIPMNLSNDPAYCLCMPGIFLTKSSYVDCDLSGISDDIPCTIEGWFYPTGNDGTLISFSTADSAQYTISYAESQLTAQISINDDNQQITSNDSLAPDNDYYHFAITYNSELGLINLYINGNLQASQYTSLQFSALQGAGSLLIGAGKDSDGNPADFFEGYIQNIRIWNTCLLQEDVQQWMYNQVVSDPGLTVSVDFSVNPPIDDTNRAQIQLKNNAAVTIQMLELKASDETVRLGILQSINATYLSQEKESPDPVPASLTVMQQPELFSNDYKAASWNDIVEKCNLSPGSKKYQDLKARFEDAFARAKTIMDNDERLKNVITRIDENGMTRLIHHGIHGDTVFHEAPTATLSDCTAWWISFIYLLTVGFLQALGLVPGTGDISVRIYNLIIKNQLVYEAITSVIGGTITATTALGIVNAIYEGGLMWPIIKLALTSAGWYTLFWLLRQIIALLTGLEAAVLLASFITWAAQLAQQSFNYNSSCPVSTDSNLLT